MRRRKRKRKRKRKRRSRRRVGKRREEIEHGTGVRYEEKELSKTPLRCARGMERLRFRAHKHEYCWDD
jgi:hypothetical protein